MSDKPSYLGLLNAIAVGEQRGYHLFDAWAKSTSNAKLAEVLQKVALREQEHAAAFSKRLDELGFAVKPSPTEEFEAAMNLARSAASDRKKFAKLLHYRQPQAPGRKKKKNSKKDPLSRIFRDKSIDIQSGALLGRFIAEERDSERLLRACYDNICPELHGQGTNEAGLKDLGERLERLSNTLEELKQLRNLNR